MTRELVVDGKRHTVAVGGKSVILRPKEMRILLALIEADGEVLSRESLLKKVWGYESSMGIDTRTVDQHVCRLRKKLGKCSHLVRTVTGYGFSFTGGREVKAREATPAPLSKDLKKRISRTLADLNALLVAAGAR